MDGSRLPSNSVGAGKRARPLPQRRIWLFVLYHSICMGIITCCCMPLGSPAGPTGVQVQVQFRGDAQFKQKANKHIVACTLGAVTQSSSVQYRYCCVYSVSPASVGVAVVACKLAGQEDAEDTTRSEFRSARLISPSGGAPAPPASSMMEGISGARISMRPNITFHDGGLPRS